MARKKKAVEPAGVSKDIRPVEISYAEKLKDDKAFLMMMIDDPLRAFRTYGFNGDDKMMAMLQGMSVNIRKRAVLVFKDILRMAAVDDGCRACNGCRACKACMTLGAHF